MYEIKEIAQDMRASAKRRRVLLILTPILFIAAAALAIYLIEPKYESATTILVQKDETLNPLVLYEIAVNMASEDRLQSLNEIIYSRSTMEILIDSLNLDEDVITEADKQLLVKNTQRNIKTTSRASDSFEISYMDESPQRAQAGAELLANHFIQSRLRLETRRHEETVNFFAAKLGELENIVSEQRNQTVNITSDRLRDLPSNSEALQSRLMVINEQLDALEWRIIQEEEKLDNVEAFKNEPNMNVAIQYLFRLPMAETQFGEELSLLLSEYETLSQQFTESYPRLRALALQIRQVADRIPPTLESNIQRLNTQKNDLTQQNERVVADMQNFFVSTQRANSQQSDFSIYEGLYNEMKVKLEQAKMTRDIGKRAADQFIVLDAANVPEKPVSPNKRLILGVGLMIGLIMGIVASAVAEVMDTTMRDDNDLPFQKPIIAYITNG